MIQILEKCPVVLDISDTGLGKTYTTTCLGAIYKLPLLVISAPTCLAVWREIGKEYEVPIIDMVSYDILRGLKGKPCNNPYLIRTKENKFVPTEHLKQLLRSGVLIVFDEISKLKNQEAGVKAASHAIVKALIDVKSGSRIVLLSALPCDKTIHILSLMQMLGIIYDDKIYKYDTTSRKYILKGFREAINWCSHEDPEATKTALEQCSEINKNSIPILAKNLYKNIIRSRLSSYMRDRTNPECQKIVKNGYYKIIGQDMELLKLGQRTLRNAVRYYGDQITNRKLTNWGEVTKALQILGISKLHTLVSLAYRDLTSNPQRKIVICAWYIDQLLWLKKVFEPFGANLLYGSTSDENREIIVSLFQEPNSKCRVIIINPTVGGMAISLDDRDGKWPRTMLGIPDFRFVELIQCTGRVYRPGSTKSKEDTTIIFIYAEQFKRESKILNSLLQKSDDARSVISDDSGLVLPDNYEVDNNMEGLESIDCPPLPIKEKIKLELLQFRERENASSRNISSTSNPIEPQTRSEIKLPKPIQIIPMNTHRFRSCFNMMNGYLPLPEYPSVVGEAS
uniref:DEAD/SNF2-like helicase n=1 Tax=Pithovirus LCPAC202 TaxID=2506592 RepID=A0A481Z7V4_9VIRU|nr:MAG: DEAD/SNF2-like helicase [Pithovirus LCPAC202]